MAFIPKGAKWYLATLVEEITVEGDSRNVVHKNLLLVRADCPEQAYENALNLGKQSESSYENPKGMMVRIKFRGLRELNVIYDELEHGAELSYQESVGVPEKEIEALLRRKEDLGVFQPITPTTGPDYSSREIVEEAKRLIDSNAAGAPSHKS
jgi:hypothetical protein